MFDFSARIFSCKYVGLSKSAHVKRVRICCNTTVDDILKEDTVPLLEVSHADTRSL